MPITNAALISRIKNIAKGDTDEIQDVIKRASDYTRAVGIIMLHSFINGHTVSITVLLSSYMASL